MNILEQMLNIQARADRLRFDVDQAQQMTDVSARLACFKDIELRIKILQFDRATIDASAALSLTSYRSLN